MLASAGLVATGAPPAAAVQEPHDRVVRDVPVGNTPHVLDGRVNAVAQVGDTVILGGAFTRVASADRQTTYNRANLVAFSASTGAISQSFVPNPSAEVMTLLISPDQQSVFVGGFFDTIAGSPIRSLAKLRVGTGVPVAAFKTPELTGRVKDLKISGGRLWVAGTFTHVAGTARTALATLSPADGSLDNFQRTVFAGNQNGGNTQVMKIDATPDGSRLVAIGNFRTVDGQTRRQIAMLNLTGATATLTNWDTPFYGANCSPGFNSYMRDVDISPDGSFFAVVTTGAYGGGPPAPCDTTARFEIGSIGGGLAPTWVDYTGGDTSTAVAITGTAVYTGGHFRWQNNPHIAGRPGYGAMDRQGLSALDPENGLPLKWNPGRTLGVGVFDLVATKQGLWVASDTDRIASWRYHGRIAYFPLSGGTEVPRPSGGALPADIYLARVGTSQDLQRRYYDGTTVASSEPVSGGGLTWQNARGAFMLGTELFTGWNNGEFTRRTFNGTTFGAPTAINASDQLNRDAPWHGDVANLTGLAHSRGKLFYTRAGDSNLYFRYYTRESDVVGAQRLLSSASIAGLDFGQAAGMFIVGNRLYVGSSADGNLRRVNFVDGKPVPGTVAVVSGPAIDGHNWRARATFQFVGDAVVPNKPPVAAISSTCATTDCDFSSAGSGDPDGNIVSYEWDFGDQTTGSGATAQHSYASPGTYTARLTVTDNDGATATATRTVTATAAPTGFVAAASANANTTAHRVQIPDNVAPGDRLVLFFSINSINPTVSAPTGVTGWSGVSQQATTSMVSRAWQKAAEPGDAGSTVTVPLSAAAKGDLTVVAYRGTNVTVKAFASQSYVGQSSFVSPTVTGPASAWLVTYWGHKASSTTTWQPPGGQTVRSSTIGAGSGAISGLLTDGAGATGATEAGGLTASTNGSGHAVVWSLLIGGA